MAKFKVLVDCEDDWDMQVITKAFSLNSAASDFNRFIHWEWDEGDFEGLTGRQVMDKIWHQWNEEMKEFDL